MPFLPSLPEDATTRHIFERIPERFRPVAELGHVIMRADSYLSPGLRELMGAYVSTLNDCAYCAGGHVAAAERFGVDPGLLQALLDDVDTAGIEDKLKPLFSYIRKLTLTPYKMVQADADTVYAAGWSERDLEDAIAVACLFSFMNRLVDGYGIVADESQFSERGRMHAEMGYLGQFR